MYSPQAISNDPELNGPSPLDIERQACLLVSVYAPKNCKDVFDPKVGGVKINFDILNLEGRTCPGQSSHVVASLQTTLRANLSGYTHNGV